MTMLTALLLVLTASATPVVAPKSFLLLQEPAPQGEPDLRWDGETEDVYRRALHLWKVRGKPAEAADLLLGIADTAEVLQIAGQSSWVLVLAAQCLAEAGRGEEAAALIPGIERGAKGTELEPFVKRELEAHQALAGVLQNGLDEAFLNSLIEVFQGTDHASIQGYATQFQRVLLPYLFEALERWQSGNLPKNVGIFAFRFALMYLDQASVARLVRFTEELSQVSFMVIVHDARLHADDTARAAAGSYWNQLADSKDALRAEQGRRGLARLAESHYEVVREPFEARLAAGDRELEAIWLSYIKGDADPAYAKWFRRAYASGGEARWTALAHYYAIGARDALLEFAESGDEDAAILALDSAVRQRLGEVYTFPEHDNASNGLSYVLDREMLHLLGRTLSRHRNTGPITSELSLDAWDSALARLQRRVHREASAGHVLLALAALVLEREEVIRASLVSLPFEAQPVIVAVVADSQELDEQFPDDVAWNWSELGVSARHRDHFDQMLARLLSRNLAAATIAQLRGRIESLARQGVLDAAARQWQAADRQEDLLSLLMDETVSKEAWIQLLRGVVNSRGEPYSRLLAVIAARFERGLLQPADLASQGSLESYYQGLFDRTPDPLAHVNEDQLLILLEASFLSSNHNTLVTHVAESTAAECILARQRFCSDRLRTAYLVGASRRAGAQDDVLLAGLRLGMKVKELIANASPKNHQLVIGSEARREAIRLLLTSADEENVTAGIAWLRADQGAYLALRDEVEPLWAQSVHAAFLASQIGVHREADPTIAQKMIDAWQLAGLQNRSLLVEALGNSADRRVVPILIEALRDPDPAVSKAASEGLARLKNFEEQRAFWESWQATGIGGSPEAALLKQARSTNREVRLAAIRALGATRAENALPLLISLLENPDADVVAAARAALAWLAEPPPPGAPAKSSDSGESGD